MKKPHFRRYRSIAAAVAAIAAALALAFAVPADAAEWRDMLREELRLRTAAPPPESAVAFADFAPEMVRLGEAFAKTAYADNLPLGRKNFATLVRNLGMQHPSAAELRQFLNPNKKPWDGYEGPTDGNCHMLFNSGTLNLSTADGSSKDHPARALAKKHLSFWTKQERVKNIAKILTATIRAQKADTATLCADPEKRTAFLQKLRENWLEKFPKDTLSEGEVAFANGLLAFSA
jgi:hypothetical protein